MAIAVPTSLIQQFDNSGNVLNGGSVTVYEDNSTTLISLFSDDGLSSSAANPITLDSAGRHAMRYFSGQSYKLVIKNSAGTTLVTRDDIDPGIPIGSGVLAIANGGTGASTAGAAVTALGAATQSSVDDLAADVAALAGAASSVEKTHIATGTTAQRPASPTEGDIRRNTTTGEWEAYSNTWEELAIQTEVTTEIAATIGLVYLSTGTASTSATIDFTTNLTDTYESYIIELASVKPATDDVSLNIRIGTGGTPTYQTSGYSTGAVLTAVGATATIGGTAQAAIITTNVGAGNGIGNASGEHVRGTIKFSNPEGSDFLLIEWDLSYVNASGAPTRAAGAGMWATTGAVTGIRFLMSSGNISSGTFRHYGIRKS